MNTRVNVLDGFGYGPAGRGRDLFRGEDCEGEGPEAVVVGTLGVVEEDLARLRQLVFLYVESFREAPVLKACEGYLASFLSFYTHGVVFFYYF